MTRVDIGRRTIAALLGAALAAPSVATGQTALNLRGRATRIRPSTVGSQSLYQPPEDMKAAIDLFRRMTAPVMVNGKGPYRFVVDTGANQSVLSTEVANELGLKVGDPSPLHGVAGVRVVDTTTVPLMQVGALEWKDVHVSVLPQEAIGGQGFLGLDLVGEQRLTLDFKNVRVVVGPSEKLDRDPFDVVLKASYRSGQLTLVNGEVAKVPTTAFLDSGAQTTIGNELLRRLASSRHPNLRWTRTEVISATGQTLFGDWAVLPSFRFGQMRLRQLPIVFADLHTFAIWGLNDEPAILIGVDVMSQFEAVTLDFERHEVRFDVPDRY